jgi:parvulin-like peptidyl-prolyl isomerase
MDIVERSTPNGPVAFVDDVAISREEFLNTYQKHVAEVAMLTHDSKPSDEFRVRAGLTTLGELVRRQILVAEADKRGVKIGDAEVEASYAEKLKRFQQDMKKPDGSAPSEQDVLKIAGQTRQEALESLRRQLIEEKMTALIAKEKGAKVTDKDITDFYSKKPELFKRSGQIHFNQILIAPKGGPKSDEAAWKAAEDTAKKARARILAGEKFDAVARDMSQSPDAAKGGDMGMMAAEQLPPFFVSVGKAMKPGDVSEPFRSPYGVHVVRLVETADSKDVTLEEAKPKIRAMLEQMRGDEAVDKHIEPVVNDPKRTQIFLQLERTLAALTYDPKAPKKPEPKKDAAVSAKATDAAAAATETPQAPVKKSAAPAAESSAKKTQAAPKAQKKSAPDAKSSTKKKAP